MSRSRSGSDERHEDLVVALADPSQVGESRRSVTALARKIGFDETGCGQAALLVNEGASNVLKHGGGGEFLARTIERHDVVGLELLFLDKGPGMADPARFFRDGVSTTGTAGIGLGALARMSDYFDVHSVPSVGTAVQVRLWARPPGPRPQLAHVPDAADETLEVAAIHLAKPGEEVSGDGWAVEWLPGQIKLLVSDGLGHGPLAAEVSREAVRVFREHRDLALPAIVERMHRALRPTRGAAVGLAEVDLTAQTMRFVGVGNIAGTIYAGGASESTFSHSGIVGHELRKIQEFQYRFPQGAVLVLHSDGLATHWQLDRYAGLAWRDPGLIAGVLYRDFKRGRDDVTVLAAREIDERSP